MERIPFGVSRLDQMIGGGAPAGSVVLLAGDSGSGAREFLHTAGVMNGLARADEELFDLHYGALHESAQLPRDIHYVSLTGGDSQIREEIQFTMEPDLVDAGTSPIEFADLSPSYFRLSPVPRDWYAEETTEIGSLGARGERDTVFDALGDYLDANGPGNLVLLDSVSDLAATVRDGDSEFNWSDLRLLVQGLEKAAHRWQGLVLLLVNKDTLSDAELGSLMEACDGTLLFEWASGGSELARTMVVRQFRGVLSQLEAENIVRFETELGEAGFDISDVRKIR